MQPPHAGPTTCTPAHRRGTSAPQPAFLALAESGAVRGRVLDAGCGTGEHALLAAGLGLDATGIDLAARALKTAEDKARARGLTARFLRYDARELAAFDEQFDTVLDCGLLHVFDGEDRSAAAVTTPPSGHDQSSSSHFTKAVDVPPLALPSSRRRPQCHRQPGRGTTRRSGHNSGQGRSPLIRLKAQPPSCADAVDVAADAPCHRPADIAGTAHLAGGRAREGQPRDARTVGGPRRPGERIAHTH